MPDKKEEHKKRDLTKELNDITFNNKQALAIANGQKLATGTNKRRQQGGSVPVKGLGNIGGHTVPKVYK